MSNPRTPFDTDVPRRNPSPPHATDDTAEPDGQFPPEDQPESDEHEGGTEEEIGDRTGPGAGYDEEPEQEPDEGGVS